MNVIIYTVKGMDYYQLGTPAKHTLSEPTISREWISRAEYSLPSGYEVSESNDGMPEIYDAHGRHCPISDGPNENPLIVDINTPSGCVELNKLRDIPW